ncbi:MAG: aconitate hydratase [Verrucomicrobiota bacterium]|nr:aconitate hydratase [Verrucomicrobiota bacterium]
MAGKNVAQKLIESHLLAGKMSPGEEIELKVDQTLTQDATGTMVMLELDAMGVKRVKTEISAQYVDHNLVQNDFKNADDHIFLQTSAAKYGIWFSPPGNGVSHPVHMERFGIPGKFLIGSDSHTCAAGSMGMLAIGCGGLEVALAMVGQPFYVKMPKIMGIKLTGKLPKWVSAKDVILEVLRRHDVDGGIGKIFEYYGPGLDKLTAMDRHVIANMGAELGATASVFPSDKQTKAFLKQQGRERDYQELKADRDCKYDLHDEIDLSKLEPLIACPSSPGNVVPVRKVAGKEVFQVMIGSSANPGLRDFVVPALVLKKQRAHPRVSLDINPTSRQILENLTDSGHLAMLIRAGARIHQAGCNGCIGMGQAPATDKISLRTVPRNFPGRSGTKEDKVYLCSPETAAASAIMGVITDPRDLEKKKISYPRYQEPKKIRLNDDMVLPPPKDSSKVEIIRGPNIQPLPKFGSFNDRLEGPVLLKLENNISTDEISPAGSKVLPFRSNIPEISKYTFSGVDETFYNRAIKHQKSGSFIVAGANYGQGSSREHAALAPSYLGVRAVLAKGYARIHRSNLVNFGILPLVFVNEDDWKSIDRDDVLKIDYLHEAIQKGTPIHVTNQTKNKTMAMKCPLTEHERKVLLEGGLINYMIKHHIQK